MQYLYPQHVLASHLNFVAVETPPEFTSAPTAATQNLLSTYTAQERAGLERMNWFSTEGRGYNLEQSTKPHTLGFGLADSPVALLAWIYEKLHDWTDAYPWTDDEVLTWISIYAFSRAGPDAASRIYYEREHDKTKANEMRVKYIDVPLGLSYFPQDLVVPPSAWGRGLGPVVFERRHESGGHFSAFERPEVLVKDVKEMFGKGGGAEKISRELGWS
jgi:hypothetical protein